MVRFQGVQFRAAAAAAVLFLAAAGGAAAADGGSWSVSKATGSVWIVADGAEPASLGPASELKPGDAIRTGANGRVLLTRGEESILIAPNSAVTIPSAPDKGLQTTILQQAGSILLEVEKKNVQHFEVATPTLAAVVKGTRFRVTVGPAGTSVAVLRGQVEVADFRSGEIAQVHPGQAATSRDDHGGLTLSGAGPFDPIAHGPSRTPAIERLTVPKGGLTAPRNADAGHHVISFHRGGANGGTALGGAHHGIRIAAALGEVRLNVHQVTHGLVRGDRVAGGERRGSSSSTAGSTTTDATLNAQASTVTTAISDSVLASTATTTSTTSGSGAPTQTATATASAATVATPASYSAPGNGNHSGNGHGTWGWGWFWNGHGYGYGYGDDNGHGHGHH
ncbi:MAG: FecR family protein [Xanthobacteraceae bacterium]|nr:FecR family protein [Xanthobacteraceae bacterium]